MLSTLIAWLVATIGKMGYLGIVCLMFLESSFFPFPSEVVIPPAGYLAFRGEMNLLAVIVSGVLGSLLGAIFNYWISLRYGRPFLDKYGKYFFLNEGTLRRAELFFARHGHISTFIGRLLPGIRQYISLPAGLARMNVKIFSIFTFMGAGIWVLILAATGYWFGNNEAIVVSCLHRITLALIVLCVAFAFVYAIRMRTDKTSPSHSEKNERKGTSSEADL